MAKRKNAATTTIRLDGEKEFKEALSRINQGLRENASGMKLAQAIYKENGKSVEDLAKVQKILEQRIRLQSKAVDEYRKMLDQAGKATEKDEKRISQLRIGYNEARTTLSKMRAVLNDNRTAMEKAGDATEDLSDELRDVEGAGNTAKKGTDIFNISLGNLISDGIQKTISAMKDLLDKTAEYRADMSKLEQNTRDANVSLDVVQKGMRSLNAITGETDSNIEALSNLLAAGFKDNDLQTAIDTLSGAVIKFPDTIKIESLADSLQETLATKEATGQFAEVLERLGIQVEKYNSRISKMSDAQARNYTISLLQNKGLMDVTGSWRENNKALIEAADANFELNQTFADLAKVIEPIKSQAIKSLNKVLSENKDTIQGVIQAVGGIINIALKAIDVVTDIPAPVLLIGAAITLVVVEIGKFTLGTVAAATALSSVSKTMALAGPQAAAAGTQFALLAVEITAVATAVALVIAAIAKLVSAIRGVPPIMSGSNLTTQPMTTTASIPRYAKGTSYHPGGLATINDGGGYPGETVLLPRGSRVFPATQGGSGDIYNYYVTIDAKNVREFNDIVRIAENQRQSRRMGHVRGY